jgi:hypothetical protein
MVILPGCRCCATPTCYPPSGNLEIDITQSAVADYESLVRFNNNGAVTEVPLFGKSTDLSGTYSMPSGGFYGNSWFKVGYYGQFISPSTSRTGLTFSVWPNFFSGTGTICNYEYSSFVYRQCDIVTLEKSYLTSQPVTAGYQNCGQYVIGGGGTLTAAPCGIPFDFTFKPRVTFTRPSSQTYTILTNTFPVSSVEDFGSSRVFTFGFDWAVSVSAARIVSGTTSSPWFNDGGADCVT